MKTDSYQERNRIARELYEAFANDLAEVSHRIDEAIGMNSTNSQTRKSLRAVQSAIALLIDKSQYMREERFELTRRERDVLELLATGASVKDVADKLYLSQPTVKTHIKNMYRKFGSSNKVETVNRARALAILPKK